MRNVTSLRQYQFRRFNTEVYAVQKGEGVILVLLIKCGKKRFALIYGIGQAILHVFGTWASHRIV